MNKRLIDKLNKHNQDYVLMLPRWYPNIKHPADGNFIEKHVKCISNIIPVKLIFVKGLEELKEKDEYSTVTLNNYEHHIIYFKLNKGIFKSILNPIRYFKAQMRGFNIIKKNSGIPQLTHVHVMARTTLLAYFIKYFYHVPFVISEHWSGYYAESGKMTSFKRFLYTLLFKGASGITTVSKSLKDAVISTVSNKQISIIPNIVDKVFYMQRESNIQPKIKRLFHISNLIIEIKQTDKIMLYLNELAQKRNDFEFWIIGDGPDREYLELLSKKMTHLENRINFKGNLSQNELASFLSEATATLSFSKFETQSLVLLESIAMGIPVIAPRTGGIPEHLEERALLIDIDSKDQFIKAIEKILDGDFQPETKIWREYIEENFSCKTVGRKFADFYKKIKPTLDV